MRNLEGPARCQAQLIDARQTASRAPAVAGRPGEPGAARRIRPASSRRRSV